jgi:hypothetical protein
LDGTYIFADEILTIHEIFNPTSTWVQTFTPIRKPIITFDPIPSQRHAKALNAHLSISQTSVLAWQETLSWDLHQMKLINL